MRGPAFTVRFVFTEQRFAEQLLHTEALTQRGLYTEKLLRTEVFTRKLYTEKLLHKEASKQSIFLYTEAFTRTKALHTHGAFTHRRFYA